jgi:hypothetical protein
MKCMAMCRETVDRPGDALGWQLLPVSGGSLWWFCPTHSVMRREAGSPGALVSTAIQALLSNATDSESP